MNKAAAREIIWTPTPERANASTMAQYIRWLEQTRGLSFDDFDALWKWSVSDLDAFWKSIWDYFDIGPSEAVGTVLANRKMPGAEWFPGVEVNYAQTVLNNSRERPDAPIISVQSETFGQKRMTGGELVTAVARVAAALRDKGVGQGDRVVAILPNTEIAIIAFLATASLGAVWSLCAPEMGHVAILDRFRQIEPKVLIAQDGYVHRGKRVDRREILSLISDGLPTLEHQVRMSVFDDYPSNTTRWEDFLNHDGVLESAQKVPFDHPLWIVYSSGTTGNPKPIVHGHGGVLLEGAKQSLHMDLTSADRFCWLTSSGWIMWNCQFVALARGALLAMFDGAPDYPDLSALWAFVEREDLTYFGAGAAFFDGCRKAGLLPKDTFDFKSLRSIGATGSPLSEDAYRWIHDAVKSDVWLAPFSGGTDLAGTFVGGNPMLPVRIGEMQSRFLGNAVRSFDPEGKALIGEVGELVCTEPLPSMPLYFWGDTDGSRLFESYYDTYPGVWRHGDWIEFTPEGGSVIYGRSDATINRRGLRLGSAEIYQAVEGLAEIQDSLVVDLEFLGRESFMPLFVVLSDNVELDEALRGKINSAIRAAVSARFLPDEIVEIPAVPRTLSGKKLEVPVKKLLLGGDPGKIVNRDSMANPDSFDYFIAYAQERDHLRNAE